MDNRFIASKVIVSLTLVPGGANAPTYEDMVRRRIAGSWVAIGDIIHWHVGGRSIPATIERLEGSNEPSQRFKVDRRLTDIQVRFVPNSISPVGKQDELSTQLVGMLRSMFNNATAFRTLRMPMVKSILIHGVSGVGKYTALRRGCHAMENCHLIEISVHDLLRLKDEFDNPEFINYNPLTLAVTRAIAGAPSILAIKNLDDIGIGASKSMADRVADLMRRQVSRIADEMKVCIVGFARELKDLPEGIKKSDVFGERLHIPIPSMQQRILILKNLLAGLELAPLVDSAEENPEEEYAKQIALRTSGYVARDLKSLCKIAVLKSLRDEDDLCGNLSKLSLDDGKKSVRWADFEYAIATIQPSQQMQVESSPPKRSWDELGGYESVKRRIRQAALLPLLQPHLFSQLGVKPPSGVLLYGPSGCGKTAFVQALASESMLNVISIKGPEIFSKYLGETELKIRRLFATAKRIAPCIMFIDEMDAISTRRGWDSGESSGGVNERVLSTLLNEMDGVEGRKGVIVIGCTNRPDQIDDAILRPGRLDQLIYMGLPDGQDRRQILEALARKLSISSDIDLNELSYKLEYCTGADIENLFREAGTRALRRDISAINIGAHDIEEVVDSVCDRAKHRVVEEKSLDVFEYFNKTHALQ